MQESSVVLRTEFRAALPIVPIIVTAFTGRCSYVMSSIGDTSPRIPMCSAPALWWCRRDRPARPDRPSPAPVPIPPPNSLPSPPLSLTPIQHISPSYPPATDPRRRGPLSETARRRRQPSVAVSRKRSDCRLSARFGSERPPRRVPAGVGASPGAMQS